MAKRKKSILTQEIVRELLDYDPATGLFTWKYRELKWFDEDGWNGGGTRGNLRNQRSWNGKHAGKPAFCTPRVFDTNTYLWGVLLWESHSAHHMAFMWMTGRWPDPEVDHEDGDGTNNRWKNLREVTRPINQQNRRRHRDYKGKVLEFDHIGIKWNGGRYGARITHNKKNVWLGTFDTLDEAVAARQSAQKLLGFTKRHGL
jgi:hypothetical protein